MSCGTLHVPDIDYRSQLTKSLSLKCLGEGKRGWKCFHSILTLFSILAVKKITV